jgi:2-methylcitrate dehydratase PrpD
MGLARAATREALGIAEYHGPRSPMMRCIDHPTMVKDGSGWGAFAGVQAALMAARGFTGAPALTVEGADVAAHWADLGSRWLIAEQYVKPEPVCRWAQAPIHAVERLMREHGVSSDEIARIEVRSFANALRLACRRPATTEEAQYSLPFPLAAAVVRGRVGPEEVTGASLSDPAILAMADRVEMVLDEAAEAAFPAARIASVALETADGQRLDSGPTETLGDPERPIDDAGLVAKFHRFAGTVMDRPRAEAIERAVWGIAGLSTGDLLALLGPVADGHGLKAAE